MQFKLNNYFKKADKEKYEKYMAFVPNFKEEKTQKFTTVILTILALIILAIFAINPTLSTIANLQKQLEDAKFVKEKLDQKISSLSILQTKYNSLQEDLPIIYSALPKKSEAPKLAGQLQTLATEANLQIIAAQTSNIPTETTENFSFYTYTISLEGNYDDMLKFVDNLTNMDRVLYISSITIGEQKNNNEANNLQITVKGGAFFKP